MAYVGLDAKLYVEDGTEWVEIKKAIDVGLNISQTAVAVGSRQSRWQAYLPGLKDAELTFGYRVGRVNSDPVLDILRDMCVDGQNIAKFRVMDGALETIGSAGLEFWGMMSSDNLGQGLEEGAQSEFAIKPAYVEDSGVQDDPTFVVVAE